jgi:peptide/nickel transport system permease protein
MKTLRVYIITRILLTIPMLLILVTLLFVVVRLMPGDPVEAMIGQNVPQVYKDQIRHSLGLDRPMFLNLRGSTARIKPDVLFLQTEPGSGGSKAYRLDGDQVLAIGNRKEYGSDNVAQTGDWLQVALPGDFSGWVSPDQITWLRQLSADMTILDEKEIEGAITWTSFHAPDGPTGDRVNAIWGQPSGVLWFGADGGASSYDSTGWDLAEETVGQDVTAVWSGQPTEWWFGTDGAGILRLKGSAWTTLTMADGLASDRVSAIWGSGPASVWVGTDRGASFYDGRTWRVYTPANGLAGEQVHAIWGDGRQTVWFGTEGGLGRFDGEAWTRFTTADGLPDDDVLSLWGDTRGALWIGTEGGLCRFDGKAWVTYPQAGQHITSIWGDGKQTIWFGMEGGLGRFDGAVWTRFTATDGLNADKVHSLWVDRRGVLWIGTEVGLRRLDSRPWSLVVIPERGVEGWAPADQFEININPFDSQYFNYLWDLVHLDLGVSLAPTRGRPVLEDLKLKFPATLELSLASLAVCVLIGVPVGAFAAHKRRSPADLGARIFSIVIWAMPVFWLGLMFQLYLGVYLGGWYESSAFAQETLRPVFGNLLPLPIAGRIATDMAPRTITGLYILDSLLTGNWRALGSALQHLLLPALTLGLYLSGVFVRLTRANMLDVLQEDFITAARARGIKERVVVYSHALKNAFIPILTMMGLQFAALLAGAILTETTFSWPGMGLFMWERIGYRDFNSIQGSVVFFAILVATVSLLVDIIYAWIDPRIRY